MGYGCNIRCVCLTFMPTEWLTVTKATPCRWSYSCRDCYGIEVLWALWFADSCVTTATAHSWPLDSAAVASSQLLPLCAAAAAAAAVQVIVFFPTAPCAQFHAALAGLWGCPAWTCTAG